MGGGTCLTFFGAVFNIKLNSSSKKIPSKPSVENDLSCSLCKSVMELLDAYLTDDTTEQQIADALKEICSILPSPLDVEYEVMITEYTDAIIELIINQYMRPDQVCEALSLCP